MAGYKSLNSFLSCCLLAASLLLGTRPALAVRPFVTDDARVVGEHLGQIETSIRNDRDHTQNLNLVALGITRNSELTVGFVDGLDRAEGTTFSITGPLTQFKYLFWESRPNRYPGLAFAVGAAPPWGAGTFRPNRWSEFLYLASTQSLFDNDRILIHANLGVSTTNPATVATWGIGTQVRVIGGLHAVLETFYNDPYAGDTGGAYQAGFRYVVNDNIQVDMTTGSGLSYTRQRLATFIGAGLRIVSGKLW